MRVLITGGLGFLGAHLVSHLDEAGHTVKLYDRPADIGDRSALAAAMVDVEGVVNLAGILGTAETVGNERQAVEVNILGAVNVLDLAAERDLPVVQIATGHEGQPNPYAITKQCATQLALARARWTGQRVSVVRAFHVYGPGQKMCPPHGSSKVRKIIPSFVARALTGMPLEVHGTGRQLIDLVHVSDVARVLADALQGPYGEVLEAGTGKPSSVLDVALDVILEVGSDSKIVHLPMRVGEPPETEVVATNPQCDNPWPYKLRATIDWYREWLL